ncbi:hypothetical protein [Hymenobacter sp.]|uniref:hypothetical protein n=1 Tax=Hymenobacter sp. TaxID=1898978 RepID=UPI00286AE649|nr:hypothetical protein [Hymenobacter sp.]
MGRVVLLPLVLVLGTVAGLGSYCEASDDTSLAWLFSGVLALGPVPAVPLYFHGYGHGLAAAYAAWPGVPWLGGLLGGLLFGATALVFAVLDRLLRPWLRPASLVLVLLVFFGVAWLEHWLWFSYVRVALTLAGAAVLYAAQRPTRRGALAIGLLGLGAAWLMRPSLAVVGFGAALPAALLLAGSWRRAAPLVLGAAAGLVLAYGAAAARRPPAETRAQVRDGYYARVLDFDQLRPQPRTPADSLGTAALGLWLMGDATLVNEALCRRAYRFDAADFYGREVPTKLRLRAGLLVRDYFPLLLALAATAAFKLRLKGAQGGFWLVQLGYVGALAVFAGVLKLPPRLELPLLDFWLLTNLVFVLRPAASARNPAADGRLVAGPGSDFGPLWRAGGAAAAAVVLVYGAKTLHRRQVLGREQRRHERAWAELSRLPGPRVRVLAGTNDLLKSLSPFRVYTPGPGPLLVLTGWPAHDPSQARLRQHLAGTPDQTECLRRLTAPGRGTRWLLSAETARWLNRRFRYGAQPGPAAVLRPAAGLAADSTLRFYRPASR